MSFNSVRCLMLFVLAGASWAPSVCFAGAAAKEPTVPENVAIIKGSGDPEAKNAAIRRLGGITEAEERNNAVVELLTNVVKTTDNPFIGKTAAEVLATIQKNVTKRAKVIYIPILIPILKEPKSLSLVRSAIAENFAETLDREALPDKQAFNVLQDIAKNKAEQNVGLRGMCIEAIGSFGDPDSIQTLADLLADADPYIKESASKALANFLEKNPDLGTTMKLAAVNKLVEMMRDLKDKPQSKDLHVIIIRVVARLIAAGAPGAQAGLEEIVRLVTVSTSNDVVSAGIEGLGVIGTAAAVEPLIATYASFAVGTTEADILHRREVVKALGQVLRVQAAKSNSDLPTVRKINVLLVKAMGVDPNVGVRESAIYSIGYLFPTKFKDEHTDAGYALIAVLEDTTATFEPLKPLAFVALQAIFQINFGKNVIRWKEWMIKTHPPGKTKP